ncbi:hypothetical protein DevBK_07310 [Devosia sp. BK]|uniref:hypothetical protein n=1 Tax=Devosia sp. BK TaxID=2871706 RepID=UPI002939DD02|nr:hypothetical protein [Devosia sp. BK]MDV3251131.1 hypothetical protein [Devosia sp. BK]
MTIAAQPFSREQKRHVQEVLDLWQRYAPMVSHKRELTGGMQWKTLRGHEYLYRYWPDPVTRKKRSTSVGRRSPETESLYRDFYSQRDAVTASLTASRPDFDLQARVSKAMRLNRMPNDAGDVLEVLWLNKLLDQLALVSAQAVAAYEVDLAHHISRPPPTLLEFLIPDTRFDNALLDDLERALSELDSSYQCRSASGVFVGERGPAVRFLSFGSLVGELDAQHGVGAEQIDALVALNEFEPVNLVAVRRSGEPVPVRVVDPRLYAVLAVLRDEDAEIGITIAELASESGRYPFDDHLLEVFPELGKREDHGLRL